MPRVLKIFSLLSRASHGVKRGSAERSWRHIAARAQSRRPGVMRPYVAEPIVGGSEVAAVYL